MSLLDIKSRPRTLYIIAPNLFACHRTAIEWGLNPATMMNTRAITNAHSLRGTTAGTPFITYGREFWHETPHGFDLDRAVETLQRTGRLRIAQEDDLRECRAYDGLPSRPTPPIARRAAL